MSTLIHEEAARRVDDKPAGVHQKVGIVTQSKTAFVTGPTHSRDTVVPDTKLYSCFRDVTSWLFLLAC